MDISKKNRNIRLVVLVAVIIAAVFMLALYSIRNEKKIKPDKRIYETVKEVEDNIKYVHYVDEDGNFVMNENSNYATKVIVYDENNCSVFEYYLDLDGNRVCRNDGYAGIERTYEYHELVDKWVCVEYMFVDMEGNPYKLINAGYAGVTRLYDDCARIFELFYLDTDGEITYCSEGYYGERNYYNEDNQITEVARLDADGNIMAASNGAVYVSRQYDSEGRTEYIWYYDIDHKPVDIGGGQYGYKYIYEEGHDTRYIRVDREGNEIFSIVEELHKRPAIVFAICLVILILIMTMGRGLKLAMLAGSIIGVLYFTLLTRESYIDSHGIDFFVQYRQFFTSAVARNEVILNIALFVPFGMILMSLLNNSEKTIIRKRSLIIVLMSSLILTLSVEITQFIFHLGIFQTDDLFGNTLGGLLGALIYLAAYWLINGKIKSEQ